MPAATGYSATQIRLHWLVFLAVLYQLIFNEAIGEAWRAFRRGEEIASSVWVPVHVFGGIAILLLVLWRIFLRVKRGAPKPPEHEPAALKMIAGLTHLLLYALLIAMPVSGIVAWFGGIEAAGEAHEVMKAFLWALIALHVLGALYHQFFLKTDVLTRMRKPAA